MRYSYLCVILCLFFGGINFSLAQKNNYSIQLGLENNFTQTSLKVDKQRASIHSFGISAMLDRKINDCISVATSYTFGRAWYKRRWTNLHKYSLMAGVSVKRVSFFLAYEYIYVDLLNLNIPGGCLGIKIYLKPFRELPYLLIKFGANIKNQLIGVNYSF